MTRRTRGSHVREWAELVGDSVPEDERVRGEREVDGWETLFDGAAR